MLAGEWMEGTDFEEKTTITYSWTTEIFQPQKWNQEFGKFFFYFSLKYCKTKHIFVKVSEWRVVVKFQWRYHVFYGHRIAGTTILFMCRRWNIRRHYHNGLRHKHLFISRDIILYIESLLFYACTWYSSNTSVRCFHSAMSDKKKLGYSIRFVTSYSLSVLRLKNTRIPTVWFQQNKQLSFLQNLTIFLQFKNYLTDCEKDRYFYFHRS